MDREAWLQSIASQRVGHDLALNHHREGREYRNKGEVVKKNSAAMDWVPVPPGGIYITIFLSSSPGTKTPHPFTTPPTHPGGGW